MGQERRAEPTGNNGVYQQREVLDTSRFKSAELSPWAMRECINKEVLDTGRVKSAELSPRAMRECKHKKW